MKKLIVLALTMGAILTLTGCSSNVKLPTALENSAKMNSYSYDISLEASSESLDTVGEEYGMSPDASVKLGLVGKMNKADGRVKNYSEVSISYGGLSIETPVYVDASEKEFDFDLFVGIPGIVKDYVAEGKTDAYLSAADLKDFLKSSMTEEEYQKFDASIKDAYGEDAASKAVSNEMLKCFFAYIEKNSKTVEKFEKLDGLKASANGVYTITLSKDDVKALVADYLNNPDYYKHLKEVMEKADTEDIPTAEDMITSFNESMEEIKDLSIVTTFTIKDKFITETNLGIQATDKNDAKTSMSFLMKLSDINKDNDIAMPDKNADSTFNLIDFLSDLNGLETIN